MHVSFTIFIILKRKDLSDDQQLSRYQKDVVVKLFGQMSLKSSEKMKI